MERATARAGEGPITRQIVKTAAGKRSEMLPADPLATAKLLRSRATKKTPAARSRDRIAADLKRRGLSC